MARVDRTWKRGKDYQFTSTIYDGARKRALVTNADTITVRLVETEDRDAVLKTWTNGSGIAVTDTGTWTLSIGDTDLAEATLPKTQYWYEIEFLNGTNNAQTLIGEGLITLEVSP